jgi:hypothetical protein
MKSPSERRFPLIPFFEAYSGSSLEVAAFLENPPLLKP